MSVSVEPHEPPSLQLPRQIDHGSVLGDTYLRICAVPGARSKSDAIDWDPRSRYSERLAVEGRQIDGAICCRAKQLSGRQNIGCHTRPDDRYIASAERNSVNLRSCRVANLLCLRDE